MENSNDRLFSLDALRGADMLCIMGLSAAIIALCKIFGFEENCWLAEQMTHVSWHGLRQHDTIFPLFLFLAGVSWPFSCASQQAKGVSTLGICLRIMKRALVLVFLGIVSRRLFAFDFANLRYDSVLAHIGICWAGAAFVFLLFKSWSSRITVAISLMFVHWLVLFLFTAPDAQTLLNSTNPEVMKIVGSYIGSADDGFSFVGNVAGWIDRTLMPGVLHEKVFDPDGLFAKLTGIALALMGMGAGAIVRDNRFSGNRKTFLLASSGVAAMVLCLLWQPWCPVNKKIWTSTFVLAAGAYSFFAFALFYWIIDVKGYRRWTFFFRVIGMNAITIYMLMRIIDFYGISYFFFSGVASLGDKPWQTFVYMSGKIAIEWLILLYFYRKKTFLRA
jgi:predicted acyltransferase